MGSSSQRIVSDSGFIDSVRDFGLTTKDAVKELVDNSFDAKADNIWITISENDDGTKFLVVEDDGEGIPQDEMASSLSFGGRLPWRQNTTGKYGFGLPASACCQSSRTAVYSKYKNGSDEFSYNYIDIDELKESGIKLPDTTVETLPSGEYDLHLDSGVESGTIVVMSELIRPQYNTIDGLVRNIKQDLAEFHREFLADGKNIYVNGEEVEYADPLMMMEGSKAVEECGMSEDYGIVEPIVFENKGEDDEDIQVEIRLAKLPIKSIIEQGLEDKYNIGRSTQGFYLIRDGRQIAGGRSLQLYNKTNRYNYFRGEIRFPSELDDEFGVQTNKSRFSLDPDLREKLGERLEGILSSLGQEIQHERNDIKSELNRDNVGRESTSEKIANETLTRLRPSGYSPTEEDVEEQESEKQRKIEEIEESDLDTDEKQERIESIREQFERDRYINKKIEVLGSGNFYDMTHKGSQMDVTLNREHPFYRQVYQEAELENTDLQVYLDLIVFTLAQTEDMFYTNEEVRRFYSSQRREWSSVMASFLENASDELGN
ncbi:hypothetical protein DJ79_12300 [Halorubrum ezzemoulense]|uniref:ATP-binding protein n=1 Tax=Halorubrum ezzemoulense TaxID=337243 RepID=A0A256JCB2_HALEZ|nr:ATP-binding protein [Halorubrum ezzemoulense]OYR66495.1 hypothetical protein DJ79_12300 [Halorubrum ezzemoulense]